MKLTRKQSGWAPLRDEATGEAILSPAPVSAFVGGDNPPYVSGSLARIANEHGMVFVMFSDQQARVGAFRMEHAEDHSRDPLGLARFLEKRVRDTKTSGDNRPVTTPASKCQRICLNMRARPHTLTAPPTPMPGVDSDFLCPCPRSTRRGETWIDTDLCWG